MATSKKAEKTLDDALEDSFPASDPPAQSQPIKKVGARKGRSADEDLLEKEGQTAEERNVRAAPTDRSVKGSSHAARR